METINKLKKMLSKENLPADTSSIEKEITEAEVSLSDKAPYG